MGENDAVVKLSSLDKTLMDLASKTYSSDQLSRIVQFQGTIDELDARYPIECARNIDHAYRVSYLGGSGIAIMIFDHDGNRVSGKVCRPVLKKSDFSSLMIGQTLDDVQGIDPNGEYPFLNTGRNDIPKISTHYTKDGYLFTVRYDATNVVSSIKEELI
jgi:hypothetical protein